MNPTPAKPATQQRSQDKRERILDAMDTLLTRRSFAEITVADLAAEADVASATIYQRFSNADATASVLLELYFQRVETWARRRRRPSPRPASLFDALVAIGADAYDQVTALGHIMRPAYLYSRHRPDRAGPAWARLERAGVEGFKQFLQQRSAKVRVRDIDEAAGLLCYLFNFMLLGPLLHADGLRHTRLGGRAQFSKAVATLAYRYLTCAGPTTRT
jgi:AcrR family transcriptional regulator